MRGFWLTGLAAGALGLGAQAEAQEFVLAQSEVVTVTATRTEKPLFEAPATVSVITAEEIEENLATDIKDLIRFEPGVSVPTSPSRFTAALSASGRDGNSGFTIRGMGGNRVLFQVDGIRVPDGFSFGPNAFGRGDYVDLDLLQSVEIVRGPASALYGSDGLAGVVSFITRDPEDFLRDEDGNFAARLRASYASVDDSWAESISAAGRFNDQWSALIAYTRRDGHETDNQGDNESTTAWSSRTVPNPQDWESNSVLGRLVFSPSDQHRFRLTADYGDRTTTTEPLTGRSATVLDLDGLDESERSRLTADYTYEGDGLIDEAFVAIYTQSSSALQFTYEDRTPAVDRTRETTYDNEVWGITAQAESLFEGAVQHRLVYGVDYSSTTQEAIRDGTVPTPPAVFPERPFPETDYERTGAFLVDEITLLDGALTLFPGVRYDSYELTPYDDPLYFAATLAGQSDSHVSPKFGVVAWPVEHFGAFFNYASGFKAPAPSEVNNYFENLTFGAFGQAYTSVPNPDLGPETSEGFEAGVRGRGWNVLGGSWDWSAAAFSSFYDDFISQEIVSGSGSSADPFVYQYVNLNEVEISGAEARALGTWDNGFGFNFAIAYADGKQITPAGSAPLESIDPLKVVAGFGYDAPSGLWGGQVIVTYSARKDADDVGAPATAFRPEAFTLLDLTAYWRITENAALRVGVFNVADETYWWWSDARGLGATSAVLDAYTQPGRNVSASISYRF